MPTEYSADKIFAFSFILAFELALEFVFQLQLALLVHHCFDDDICQARLGGKNR
jgi:hypothetical protein